MAHSSKQSKYSTNTARLMKTVSVAFVLLGVSACAQQDEANGVQVVPITAHDVEAVPPGESLVLDITQPNVVYYLSNDDGPLDLERVVVWQSDDSVERVSEYLDQTGPAEIDSDRELFIYIGHPDALATLSYWPVNTESDEGRSVEALRRYSPSLTSGFGVALLSFTCSLSTCTCTGDNDCNDMFSSSVCGDLAVCDESGPETTCWCWRW